MDNAGKVEELVEEVRELKGIKKKYEPMKLSSLDASSIGKYVSVDCQKTGEESQKALVIKKSFECPSCSNIIEIDFSDDPTGMVFKNDAKPKRCTCGRTGKFKLLKEAHTDYSIIYARDRLDSNERFEHEKYESKRLYVITKKLPSSNIINIKGLVVREPNTNNISIIATKIKPLENQMENFQITPEMKTNFNHYFSGSIDLSEEINPDIVGFARKLAKQCIIAQLHSPIRIFDIERKKIIRGGLNVCFLGDTKVGKSEIAKDITNERYYGIGEYAVVETAGRTGLLYTIDNDRKALIWGSLPLNDMGLLVLDGLQNIYSDEMGQFREAMELQKVIVNRSVKGVAPARTRVLGCMNPDKPMKEYIFKCECIPDNYVFKKTPELTRWDLFVAFCNDDVSHEEIAQRQIVERKIPKQVMVDHISWVWSRKPDQVTYEPEAIKTIKEESIRLLDDYCMESLPIVHNGVRDVLSRLSVSCACQVHRTDETHTLVIVTKEDVLKAVEFYREVLDMLDLAQYKGEKEGDLELTGDEMVKVSQELGELEYKILGEIRKGFRSSAQLSALFSVNDKTIKRHYDLLKKHDLIKTSQGKGVGLSPKGVMFLRWLYQKQNWGVLFRSRDIGTKPVPMENTERDTNVPMSPEKYIPPKKKQTTLSTGTEVTEEHLGEEK